MASKDHVPLSSQPGRFCASALSKTVPEKQRSRILDSSVMAGLDPPAGRSPFAEAKARPSIFLGKTLRRWMDTRVKPAYDAIVAKRGFAPE